jgi:lysophospholipase L1-like esterase
MGVKLRFVNWSRFVALGDSFTEGLDDPNPDGTYRGWADLVADTLGVRYANFAVRGKLFDAVVKEQVKPGLALKPDLISFAAGGNDVLRRQCDPPALMKRYDKLIKRLRATRADVVVFRFANLLKRLPGNKMIGPRVHYVNDHVGETAQRYGARLVDLWADDEFDNPAMWSVDRLHLSTAGHLRTAAHVLTALDVEPDPLWWKVPPWPAAKSWPRARADDVVWAGRHLLPWIQRRLTGKSSGDGRTAKRPGFD